MTQIFITMQGYVKGEVVSVDDIKLGSRCRCVISFVFQAHFTSEERAPNTH
jgi:cytoskeletal protein CcmA (bactofilin family)